MMGMDSYIHGKRDLQKTYAGSKLLFAIRVRLGRNQQKSSLKSPPFCRSTGLLLTPIFRLLEGADPVRAQTSKNHTMKPN